MQSKKVKIEPFYLSTVITYINSMSTFENFRKVSKNCSEAVMMLHTNPHLIFRYIPYLLKTFPNINTLYGNINEISDEITEDQCEKIEYIDSSRFLIGTRVKESLFEKITGLRVDFSYYQNFKENLNKMNNLRTLITENIPPKNIDEFLQNEHLRLHKLTCYVYEIKEDYFDKFVKDLAGVDIEVYFMSDKKINVIDSKNVHFVHNVYLERVIVGKEQNEYEQTLYKCTRSDIDFVLNSTTLTDVKLHIRCNECNYMNFENTHIDNLDIEIDKGVEVKIVLPREIKNLTITSNITIVNFVNLKECKCISNMNIKGKMRT